MTFKDAIKTLDSVGCNAIKRPSMRGYAYRKSESVATGEDVAPESDDIKIALVSANGEEVILGENEVKLTAELFNALVLADDWEYAPKAEYEKARAGTGEM